MKITFSFITFLIIVALFSNCNKNNSRSIQGDTTMDTCCKEANINLKDAVLQNIFNRKSVRSFNKNKQIPKPMLEEIVKAGMSAPSAMDLRPWQFIVVTGRAKLDKLSENLPYAKMLLKSTAAIIVCGDTDVKSGGDNPHCFWLEDCSAATENILLAVEAMGLGAVWTATYPYGDRMDWTIKCLELPKNILPLCVIPIGYPDLETQPKDKYDPKKIHWEKW
jgi:nitroreductase